MHSLVVILIACLMVLTTATTSTSGISTATAGTTTAAVAATATSSTAAAPSSTAAAPSSTAAAPSSTAAATSTASRTPSATTSAAATTTASLSSSSTAAPTTSSSTSLVTGTASATLPANAPTCDEITPASTITGHSTVYTIAFTLDDSSACNSVAISLVDPNTGNLGTPVTVSVTRPTTATGTFTFTPSVDGRYSVSSNCASIGLVVPCASIFSSAVSTDSITVTFSSFPPSSVGSTVFLTNFTLAISMSCGVDVSQVVNAALSTSTTGASVTFYVLGNPSIISPSQVVSNIANLISSSTFSTSEIFTQAMVTYTGLTPVSVVIRGVTITPATLPAVTPSPPTTSASSAVKLREGSAFLVGPTVTAALVMMMM